MQGVPSIRGSLRRASGVAALLLALPLLAVDEGDSAAPPVRPVHDSAKAVVEHVLGAARAFLAEDGATMRTELDALDAASPALDRERDEAYGHELLSFDQAFHITIDRARESATAGRLEDAFNQLVWVQRTCVSCHRMAREKGWLPGPAKTTPAEGEAGH